MVIIIVGCGLVGPMMALLLTKYFIPKTKIIILEKRSNPLQQTNKTIKKRSINLALSYRGIIALEKIDLWNKLLNSNKLIEMKGRMVHLKNKKISKQYYSINNNKSEYKKKIWSVSRELLQHILIEEVIKHKEIEIIYNVKIDELQNSNTIKVSIKTENNKIIKKEFQPFFIIGADGVNSIIRKEMCKFANYECNKVKFDHSYKELKINLNENIHPSALKKNYLHIWPKNNFMLIALPNFDNSFTCTLFAPTSHLDRLDHPPNIEYNSQEHKILIKNYLQSNFPLAYKYMKIPVSEFLENPTSSIKEVNLNKWHYKNKICLIGDSAHAICPFYGQGMNSGFEDCLFLMENIRKYYPNLEKVKKNSKIFIYLKSFNEFSSSRIPSINVLSYLSRNNYLEMRSLTKKKWFVVKKLFEKKLNYYFPNLWKPIYIMVTFSNIEYDKALWIAQWQDRVLLILILLIIIFGGVFLGCMFSDYYK